MRKSSDLISWIALSLTDHIGSKTLQALQTKFHGDPLAILSASPDELQSVPGIGPKIATGIQSINLDAIEHKLRLWEEAGLSIALLPQPGGSYPCNLLESSVDDPPLTLFMRVPWQPAFNKAVAIVGTRTPTPESATCAYQLGQMLAQQGVTVISGLARGIDTAGLEGALSTPAGRGVAVLGSGIQQVYPPENVELARRCALQGCVLSEVAPDAPPNAARLVARNRIISGLSRAVIVVETTIDGGAMHAARFARKYGRPIFTLESPETGNQQLLAEGAMALKTDLSNFDLLLHELEKYHA